MNDKFFKLLEMLEMQEFQNEIFGDLKELTVNKADNSWFFDIVLENTLSIDTFDKFKSRIGNLPKKLKYIDSVDFRISYNNISYQDLLEYYDYVLRTLAKTKPRFNSIIDFEVELKDNRIQVICPSDGTFVTSLLYDVKKELQKIGLNVILGTRICEEKETITSRIEKNNKEYMNKVTQQSEQAPHSKKFLSYRDKYIRSIKNTIKDIPISEDDFIIYKSMHEKPIFSFEGEVTSVDFRKINDNTSLFTFIVSDTDDSIHVKKFVRDKEEATFLSGAKIGMLMKVSGFATFDKFIDEVSITAQTIERTEKIHVRDTRVDLETEKRVELHLHSKMSTMDAITGIGEYVNAAKKWGHKAIALTDHSNVQAYPEFFKATKDKSIKPIYGVEFSFVDEETLKIVKNPIDTSVNDATYVVFDIETTGLSVNYDKIIEIAAVKIHNNQIIDEYETYVNPEIPISALITKITSITNSDVKDAPIIDDVIKDIKSFFGDSILVAHNAHFDMGHIYENFEKFGINDKEYTVIDTLSAARNMYNDKLLRFNLKAVAKMMKVELIQHHRAIYDTRATAEILLYILRDFNKLGKKNILEINDLTIGSGGYKHTISKHINLLVQNQTGLRNMFQIVSIANTDNFHKEAKLLKSVLDKFRDGIMVGSGCMNSVFFEVALNKNYAELKEMAKYYDYLEVQPPIDYMYLGENFTNIEFVIKDTIEKIIKVGKELNIPVVATGDVHHLELNESIYRDIYVQSPVVGGGRHPLVRFKNIPSQYFRTTTEMLEEFEYLGSDVAKELVVTNTNLIADKIDFVQAFHPELYAPTDDFLALEGIPSVENKLIKMVSDKAKSIYGDNLPMILQDRINKEIKSITVNKFSTVYYISHLLVKKSLDDGYLVGSRGSVG
ncbi:MAG: PHP domain-containing protein, partial [Candidatus Izemoplasma sp.]